MPGSNVLVLVGALLYLVASLVLWQLLLKEPPRMGPRRGRPRWPVRLAKAFATLLGGAAAGAASVLVVVTVVNAGRPATLTPEGMLGVWAVASVLAMLYIGRASLTRWVVIRSCLALGVQGVILPLATLISFIVAGARLADSAGTGAERSAEVLGIRLVGNLPAIWIGLAGFGLGLLLVIVADRPRRRVRRQHLRRRIRSSRAGVISARTRRR